jgi:hypothetical protein
MDLSARGNNKVSALPYIIGHEPDNWCCYASGVYSDYEFARDYAAVRQEFFGHGVVFDR